MTADYVPFDVWKCVAEHMSNEDLKKLRSVNPSFRFIVQQFEYRNVGIKVWEKRTKECLKALGNPARGLGYHVCALEITPWTITSPVKVYTKRAKIRNGINTFFDSEYPARRASDHVKRKLAKHIDLVINTVQNLPNLHEFSVQWFPDSTYHPEFFSAFLGPILTKTKLGLNLTKLSVKVPTEKLSTLAPLHLPKLTCLELDLHTGTLLTGEINDLLDSLIVFVNNTTPTLRTLSVSSTTESKHLDLNRFFHLLGFFPLLTSFTLCVPYDGAHISSPSFVFARSVDGGAPNTSTPTESFIKKHAGQLEELQIKCRRASPPVSQPDPRAKFWVQRILADIAGGDLTIGVDGSAGSNILVGGAPSSTSLDFTPAEAYSRLQKLQVPLRPLKSSLQPLHACLQVVSVQLKSLTLTERALTEDELKGIISVIVRTSQHSVNILTPLGDALSNSSQLSLFTSSSHSQCKSPLITPPLNLVCLSLRVQKLSPKLLDLLAEVVPGLETLEVEVVDTTREYTPCQLAHAAQQHRHYSDWRLRVIRIKAPQSPRVYAWCQGIERVLKACIPGLDVEIELRPLV